MDTSWSAVTLEDKLPERLKQDFSRLFTSDESPIKNRMQSLMKFLLIEKKAAYLRTCNYSSKSSQQKSEEDTVTSQATGVGRGGGSFGGRGRGGGTGKGRGGRGRDSHAGGAKGGEAAGSRVTGSRGRGRLSIKRGEPSTKCLVCEGDHATSKCDTWRDKKSEKLALLGLAFNLPRPFCAWCLEPGHAYHSCTSEVDVACPCGSDFNLYLCCKTDDCKSRSNWQNIKSATTSISSSLTLVNGVKMGETLLPIQMIKVSRSDVSIRVMFDNCSQSTFIHTKTAKKLNLKGVSVDYILICTDGTRKKMKGFIYKLKLRDIFGTDHEIEAIGLDKLSSVYCGLRVTNIRDKVDGLSICNSLTDSKLDREEGELDLLMGTDLAHLHPMSVANVDQLVLMRSMFSTGWTVMGHHKELVELESKQVGVRVNVCAVERIKVDKIFDNQISTNMAGTKDLQFLDAMSTESIGVNIAPKCTSCKLKTENCKECKMKNETMTYLEYLQDKQINDNIEFLPEDDRYIASYPYTNEIFNLLSNENIALNRAKNLENNLMKRPEDMELLNHTLTDSFKRGVFRFLSDQEMEEWEGLLHYIAMNRVYKDSDSTPVRLVFDSGQPDKNGRSLNGCMGKGKNPLNHFGSVCLKFRSAEQVASGDIKKMFNQVGVRPQDQHLRRFFVRPDGFGGKEPFRVAVITCINFGEKAAGGVATAVKNRCAEENSHICPEVAEHIQHKCFMDDINITAKYKENLDDKISKAEEIMKKGGFSFKKWIKSGDKGEKELGNSETGLTKSLGMSWKTELDKLVYRVRLNFSKKSRNRYSNKFTTLATLEDDFPKNMTKRLALKLNHTIFDPAMLLQPWILKLRLAFRNILIHEKETECSGWDIKLPDSFREEWLELTKEMFDLESLEFDRSLVPRGYDDAKKPMLVLFSDGSDKGQCVVSYLVWQMKHSDQNCITLVTSRTKISSMTKITTPRSELNAAQLQCRLKNWLHTNLDLEIGATLHVVDASIILGMITNISLKFDTYTAPRVTEIQTNTDIESWFWVDTKDNPSDLGTRGKVTVKDMNVGTMWREGPAWLKSPRSTWPLRSDFKKHDVPGLKKEFEILQCATNLTQLIALDAAIDATKVSEEILNSNVATENLSKNCKFPDIATVIDASRFSCWFKLLRVSAQVLVSCYILMKKSPPNLSDARKIVKNSWMLSMMPETRKMLQNTKLTGLMTFDKNGIVCVTTRNKQENLNPDALIVLSPRHLVTRMILRSFHEISHRGVQHTVARSRLFYWIPQASKMVRAIKNRCFRCRLRDAEAMRQLMAPLPAFRLKSSPVWHYSMLDLFGPINVRNFVNQRTSRKTWGVVITCLTTRACQVYLAESFSTDHLLMVLSKHEARNGSPAEYFADLGRQIVGADRALAEGVENLDVKTIEKVTASREVKFNFGTAHFPEGQGAVERLVQEVKKNLMIITNNHCLSFGELDTALAEASYLINCRPLQPNPTMGEDGFICPNDIIMGRSDKTPPMEEIFDTKLTRRVAHMRRVVDEFWKKWSHSYYQSLVKYHKWRLRERNAEPGDVVLVLDREGPKGKFTLGKISTVKTDDDGIVRKVTVQYKLSQGAGDKDYTALPYKYAQRNVRGLALVVTAQERAEVENIDLDDIRFSNDAATTFDANSVPDDERTEAEHEEKEDELEEIAKMMITKLSMMNILRLMMMMIKKKRTRIKKENKLFIEKYLNLKKQLSRN